MTNEDVLKLLEKYDLIPKEPAYSMVYQKDINKIPIDVLINLFNTNNVHKMHAKVKSYCPLSITFYREYNTTTPIANFTNFIKWETRAYYTVEEVEYIMTYCKIIRKINARNENNDR